MRTSIAVAIGLPLCLLSVLTGCGNSMAMPDLLHPGSLAYQQWRAQIFDPYPTPYLGHPDEDARPPQFKTPVPEPQDNGPSLFNRLGPQPPKYSTQPMYPMAAPQYPSIAPQYSVPAAQNPVAVPQYSLPAAQNPVVVPQNAVPLPQNSVPAAPLDPTQFPVPRTY